MASSLVSSLSDREMWDAIAVDGIGNEAQEITVNDAVSDEVIDGFVNMEDNNVFIERIHGRFAYTT